MNFIQQFSNLDRIVGAVAVQVSNALVLDKMIKYFLDDLGIVFYTNMVRYPDVLSIQTLPFEIKSLVDLRLAAVSLEVPSFKYVKSNPILKDLTLNQINGIRNFMWADDKHGLWPKTLEFNRRLDASRNSKKFEEITPEFKLFL